MQKWQLNDIGYNKMTSKVFVVVGCKFFLDFCCNNDVVLNRPIAGVV